MGNNLITPFGNICLNIDGSTRPFSFSAIIPEKPFAGVNGVFKLEYDYVSDGNNHIIELLLDNPECNALVDSGERLTAVSADIGDGRITLAFIEPDNLDFEIEYRKNGITLRSSEKTASQTLKFGVCWIDKLPSADDVQTWLGADVK